MTRAGRRRRRDGAPGALSRGLDERHLATASAARRSRSASAIALLICLGARVVRALGRAAQSVRSRDARTCRMRCTPPAWMQGGTAEYPARHRRPGPRRAVGDHVRRAHLARSSASRRWLFSMLLGVTLGLLSRLRRRHGSTRCIMRIADVQLSFPAILIALLIDGVARVAAAARRARPARAVAC